MKPTPHILTTAIALLTSAAFSAEPVKKNESSSTVTATTSGASGKATITIDVNGKKETREIDLGNGTEIKVTTSGDGVGSSAIAIAGGSAKAGPSKPVTWLGVAPEEVSDELRAQLPIEAGSGLIVRSVTPDSPAEKAGLQKNDVLMKLDDQLLTNPSQLRTLVAAKKDGDTVKLTYLRRGQQATVEVKLSTHEEAGMDDLKNWLPKLGNLGPLFQAQTRAVVVDKDGKVIGGKPADLSATVEQITKSLRDMGIDDKTLAEATRSLTQSTSAVGEALKDAGIAKEEVQKNSPEIAKALERVRDELERVRKQTEEALRKAGEKQPAEKQP